MKITIVGSASGHGFSEKASDLASELGKEIALRKHTLLYGPEISESSLPYLVAKSCKMSGGTVIAIAIGSARTKFYDMTVPTFTIYTEGAAGAGREVVLANSADVIVSVGGGSGTLTEISIGYMNFVPVVCMKGSGGWSDKLAGSYLDSRQKYVFGEALTAEEAIDNAEELYQQFRQELSQSDAQFCSLTK